MIALMNETQLHYLQFVLFFAGLVAITIVAVIASDLDRKHLAKKEQRQKLFRQNRLRKQKEDEAAGQYIIDQAEGNRHDFDDAS